MTILSFQVDYCRVIGLSFQVFRCDYGKESHIQPSTFSEIVRSLLDSIWIAHLQFTLTGRSAHCVFSAGGFYLVLCKATFIELSTSLLNCITVTPSDHGVSASEMAFMLDAVSVNRFILHINLRTFSTWKKLSPIVLGIFPSLQSYHCKDLTSLGSTNVYT